MIFAAGLQQKMPPRFVTVAGKNQFARLYHKDAIKQVSLLENVRRANHSEFCQCQRLQQRHERFFISRIETGRGFVQKQDARLGQ